MRDVGAVAVGIEDHLQGLFLAGRTGSGQAEPAAVEPGDGDVAGGDRHGPGGAEGERHDGGGRDLGVGAVETFIKPWLMDAGPETSATLPPSWTRIMTETNSALGCGSWDEKT